MNSQREQLFDLFQRKSQQLRVADEPQTPERLVGIDAIARDRSRRTLQEPPPLVVTNGLSIKVSLLGQVTNC
jgi:hypothetical protein